MITAQKVRDFPESRKQNEKRNVKYVWAIC